ncbi:MAG: hypothetical protein KAJ14_09420, partial [Candidatus Omnitrophica bacterium]|nr:hypothetical protein [Candidatus Omnitrophota bacterium]
PAEVSATSHGKVSNMFIRRVKIIQIFILKFLLSELTSRTYEIYNILPSISNLSQNISLFVQKNYKNFKNISVKVRAISHDLHYKVASHGKALIFNRDFIYMPVEALFGTPRRASAGFNFNIINNKKGGAKWYRIILQSIISWYQKQKKLFTSHAEMKMTEFISIVSMTTNLLKVITEMGGRLLTRFFQKELWVWQINIFIRVLPMMCITLFQTLLTDKGVRGGHIKIVECPAAGTLRVDGGGKETSIDKTELEVWKVLSITGLVFMFILIYCRFLGFIIFNSLFIHNTMLILGGVVFSISILKFHEMLCREDFYLEGITSFDGKISGNPVVIKNVSEIGKLWIGDILVTSKTNIDMLVAMKRANAIITEEEDYYAQSVAEKWGIPCFIGVKEATKILKDRKAVFLDGQKKIVTTVREEEEIATSLREELIELLKEKNIDGNNLKGFTTDEIRVLVNLFKVIPGSHLNFLGTVGEVPSFLGVSLWQGFVVNIKTPRTIRISTSGNSLFTQVTVLHELAHIVDLRNESLSKKFYDLMWTKVRIPGILLTSLSFVLQSFLIMSIGALIGIPDLIVGIVTCWYISFYGIFYILAGIPEYLGLYLRVFPGILDIWLRKESSSCSFVTQYAMSGPKETFSDDYSKYVIFGDSFRRATTDSEDFRKQYAFLKHNYFSGKEYTLDRDGFIKVKESFDGGKEFDNKLEWFIKQELKSVENIGLAPFDGRMLKRFGINKNKRLYQKGFNFTDLNLRIEHLKRIFIYVSENKIWDEENVLLLLEIYGYIPSSGEVDFKKIIRDYNRVLILGKEKSRTYLISQKLVIQDGGINDLKESKFDPKKLFKYNLFPFYWDFLGPQIVEGEKGYAQYQPIGDYEKIFSTLLEKERGNDDFKRRVLLDIGSGKGSGAVNFAHRYGMNIVGITAKKDNHHIDTILGRVKNVLPKLKSKSVFTTVLSASLGVIINNYFDSNQRVNPNDE